MSQDQINSTLTIHEGIAKQAKKRRGQTTLIICITLACAISATAFAVYFAILPSLIGIISFSICAVIAYAVSAFIIIKNKEKLSEDTQTIRLYLQQNGDNSLSAPALDAFCVTSVKVMFVILSAIIFCSIPLCITILQGMTITQIFTYLGNCLSAFWGVGKQDFFGYVIGVGLMAGIFAIILLIIRFVLRLIK